MGSLLHPVGPEEPRVYWVRRALVLVTVAAVAFGMIWLVWPRQDAVTAAPAGTGAAPSTPATAVTSPSTSPSPTAPPGR